MKFYTCENKSCSQGAQSEASYFSGGMTAEQKTMLTGAPAESLKEGTDYGEGVCPTCGEKGKVDKEVRASTTAEGSDS